MCTKSHVLFHLFYCLIYTYWAWLAARSCRFRVQVLPCLRAVLFYYTFGFTLSWTFSMQSHGLSFWKNPSWVALKKIFNVTICHFCPIMAFFSKKCQKYGEGRVLSKIDVIFGLTTLKYPYEYPFLFVIWEKGFGTWKTLHSHCFSQVTCKSWVGLPREFISLITW